VRKGLASQNSEKQFKDLELENAIHWSQHAWQTVYFAITVRSGLERPYFGPVTDEFVIRYAILYLLGFAEKILKYHTVYLYARQRKEQLPIPPSQGEIGAPGILAGGWVYKRCKELMRSSRYRDKLIALDIKMSKVAMPCISETFKEKAREDYLKKMTNPPRSPRNVSFSEAREFFCRHAEQLKGETGVWDERVRLGWMKSAVARKIRETVHEIYGGKKFKHSISFPKDSASLENPCYNGGQLGFILSLWLRSRIDRHLVEDPICPQDVWCTYEREIAPNRIRVVSQPSYDRILVDSKGEAFVETMYSKYLDYLLDDLQETVDKEIDNRLLHQVGAVPYGIPEPFKVRTITKSESCLVYRVTELQKFLWQHLKKCPVFSFTGAPDTVEAIRECFDSEILKGLIAVSGDYDGATDNLRQEWSNFCWDCIAVEAGLDLRMHMLGRKMLTGFAFGSKGKKGSVLWTKQMNGQLMGSPMSFPILCIINFACWACAYDKPASHVHLTRSNLKINGDDIAFIADADLYQQWWCFNDIVGLFPSMGKNVRSHEDIEINSHVYHLRKVSGFRTRQWFYEPFCNLALAQNVFRKGMDAGDMVSPSWMNLGTNVKAMTRSLSYEVGLRLVRILSECVHLPSEIPLDLPEKLFGFGYVDASGNFSDRTREIVGFLLTRNRPAYRTLNAQPGIVFDLSSQIKDTLSEMLIGHDNQETTIAGLGMVDERQRLGLSNPCLLGVTLRNLLRGEIFIPSQLTESLSDFHEFHSSVRDQAWRDALNQSSRWLIRLVTSSDFHLAMSTGAVSPASRETCSRLNVGQKKVPVYTPYATLCDYLSPSSNLGSTSVRGLVWKQMSASLDHLGLTIPETYHVSGGVGVNTLLSHISSGVDNDLINAFLLTHESSSEPFEEQSDAGRVMEQPFHVCCTDYLPPKFTQLRALCTQMDKKCVVTSYLPRHHLSRISVLADDTVY
jgi:hypothetical protein